MTGVGEDPEKRDPRALWVRMQTGAVAVENSVEVPQKIKNGTTVSFSNPTSGYLSEENTNSAWYLHPRGHRSIIHDSQHVEMT